MATITIRLEESTRDALQERADAGRVTLSEFVRTTLEDAVFRFRANEEAELTGYHPDTMSVPERHQLALLHRILARVVPEDGGDVDGDRDYQLQRARVLEEGYTQEYWTEFAAIEGELSRRDSDFVMDVMQMFRSAKDSIKRLRRDGTAVPERLEDGVSFGGFDHNHSLESKMAGYLRYLVEHGRWEEQREFVLGPTSGNSHGAMCEVYSRMLTEYRRIMETKPLLARSSARALTVDELWRIANASVHPSSR